MTKIAPIALAVSLAAAIFTVPADAQQNRAESERPTLNQLTAQDDARIAQIKAQLRLTADQESEWGKLETALKDISKRRAERRLARMDERDKRDADKEAKPFTAADRMRQAADALQQRAEELRAIADASEPLYAKFNDNQRRRVDQIIRQYTQARLDDHQFEDDYRTRRRYYN